ncbi:MAG: hypothetical protein ACJAYU_002847 [Bradymonadia bacterium]
MTPSDTAGTDVTIDGGGPDSSIDAGSDPDASEPTCESLQRAACVDGIWGDCLDGYTPASAAEGAACCASDELPTSDGLGCEVPPECVGVDCQNGGQCAVVAGLGICDCLPGTDGDRCETVCPTELIQPTDCTVQLGEFQGCLGWFDDETPVAWSGDDCEQDAICTTVREGCETGCVDVTFGIDLGQS